MRMIATDNHGIPLHPFCNSCGWRKGGVDSWNGRACKCGHSEPVIVLVDNGKAPEVRHG